MAGPPVVFMDGAVPLAAMAMSDSVDEKIAWEPEMQNGDDNDNDNKNGIDVDDNNNYHDDVADADLLEEQKEKLVSSPETKMGGQTVVLREYAHRLSSQSRYKSLSLYLTAFPKCLYLTDQRTFKLIRVLFFLEIEQILQKRCIGDLQ